VTRFCLLIFIALMGVQSNVGSAQTPAYWPTNGWRSTTPEQQGLDSAKLAEALDYIRQHDLNIHSLLIVRNGYLVLDAYFYPYDARNLHDLASVTKSVISTLIGIAIDQGRLKSTSQHVPDLFPQRSIANPDERKQAITIESLLTMTSGLKCQPDDNELTLHQMMASEDWVQFMLDLPMADQPGIKFVYCSGGMHLLSGIISQATSTSAIDFARRTLFEPLGIHDAVWPIDPHAINHGWGDLHLHPRDMAKLGYLYLNHGSWEGKHIVSPEWVAGSTSVHVHTGLHSDYGYGWWVRPKDGLYEAVGRGGQRITVLPDLNLVVVMTGGGFEPGDVGNLLGPAIKSTHPLPENRAAVDRLAAAVETATRPPAAKPIPPLPAQAKEISGKTFVMEQNPIGLQTLTLMFAAPTASAQLKFADGRTEARQIGLDGVPRLGQGGRFALPVAIEGSWLDQKTFVLDYDEVGNINDFRLSLTFDDNAVAVELSERTANVTVSFKGAAKE
jgi:CubicO group peptidase (beta-lactamase class C family)